MAQRRETSNSDDSPVGRRGRRVADLIPIERFGKFLIVGGAGFILDFTIMSVLIVGVALPPVLARVIAFAVAVAFTYACNRAFTFGDRGRLPGYRWVAYAIASMVSALLNLGVFVTVLMALDGWPLAPYAAMPVGVAAGMLANFVSYNFVVFRSAPVSGQHE